MSFKPRYIVTKAEGVGGDPIPTGEPCLVIRAQDVLAVPMLAYYIELYSKFGDEADPMVMHDLGYHMVGLIEWQKSNRKKVKRADRTTVQLDDSNRYLCPNCNTTLHPSGVLGRSYCPKCELPVAPTDRAKP